MNVPADITQIYERIWKGSMPGLVIGKLTDRDIVQDVGVSDDTATRFLPYLFSSLYRKVSDTQC